MSARAGPGGAGGGRARRRAPRPRARRRHRAGERTRAVGGAAPALDPAPMGWQERGWYSARTASDSSIAAATSARACGGTGASWGLGAAQGTARSRSALLEDVGADGAAAIAAEARRVVGVDRRRAGDAALSHAARARARDGVDATGVRRLPARPCAMMRRDGSGRGPRCPSASAASRRSGTSPSSRPGRVTGFLGPNGAGKCTTLRALLGLVRPSAGPRRSTAAATRSSTVRATRRRRPRGGRLPPGPQRAQPPAGAGHRRRAPVRARGADARRRSGSPTPPTAA